MEANEHSINKSDEQDICQSNINAETKCSDQHGIIIQPKRKIVVEPMLMMYYLASSALSQVYQLYVYDRMEEIVAQRTGLNISTMEIHHTRNHTNNPCEQEVNKYSVQYNFTQAAQAENAHFSMVSQLTTTLPSLISMILLGSYSDKGGRRITIVPYIVAKFISSILFFFVLYFKLSVWILQINNVICGLTGGWALMYVGCYSYIADTTKKEERLFRFTLLKILEELVSIIGPIGIGYWIKQQGYLWPIVFVIAGNFINTIYAVFFIPETVKKDKNTKFLSLSHMKRSVQVFVKNDETNRRWKLWTLLLVFTTCCIGTGVMNPLSLFELNTPLCWDSVTIGYYKTTLTAVAALGGLCFTRGLKVILSDEAIGIIASLAQTSQYIFRIFIKNTLMMFLSTAFGVFTIAFTPTTRALMSQHVTLQEHGSMFGVIGVVESLALLAGGEFFSFIYAKTLYISTTFVFLVAAVIFSFDVIIYIFYTCRLRQENRQYQRLEESG